MTSLKDGVGVLLPLLLSLLLLAVSKSYASQVADSTMEAPTLVAPAPEPAPAQSQTSENLIDNNNWNGATYGADPGGCCSSISGSGALYDTTSDTIMFSYGRDILSQTIAINQALQQSGIQVDGYNYGWTWRTISNNGNGGDTLQFEVTVKDAAGNEVERYVYDYSSADHAMDVWHTESGTETFVQSYLDPQSIALKIIGKDGGFWAGYYGPEVKDVSLTLNYSANPCAVNPLYDPSCEGYADAYAEQQYTQNCAANPLYDSGCPGYTTAYYNQQCSINALYDTGCPNYAQAYFDQQCSLNALYDTGCSGYAQAYFDQQCELDPFYDTQCSGYAEAVVETYVTPTETTDTSETISTTSETVSTVVDTEEIGKPSTTGDATVDSILKDLADVPTTTVGMEMETMETVEVEPETQEASSETETASEADATEEMVASVETEVESGDDSESTDEADGSDDESSDESEGKDSDGGDTKSEKQDSKKEKMKKAIAAKAANLANDMSNMASLEAQQAVQAQVLALINYVPDFNTYQRQMNGGYLPDAVGYADTQVPESRQGLRNGLAQQLLHEQMVEMQYENLSSQ